MKDFLSDRLTVLVTQANGLDERWSQTLQNMLVKYANNKREEWDVYLDTCVYAYNTSVQESTRFSPFEVMYGRKATLPIEIDTSTKSCEERLQKCLEGGEVSPSKIGEMASQRQEILQQVKANIKQAQDKQKEYYDRKHAKPSAYQVRMGDYVICVHTDFAQRIRSLACRLHHWNQASSHPSV